jgi:hypothetical protein
VTPALELRFGGAGYQEATSIAAFDSTLVVGGTYAEGLEYLDQEALPGVSGSEGFVLGLSSETGEVRFAHALVGVGDDAIIAVTPADEGFIAAGRATEGAVLDGVPFEATPGGSAFLSKLDSDGGLVWARVAAGDGVQTANAVVVAEDGGIYAAGDFSGELDFGMGTLAAEGESDIFLAHFSPAGEPRWIRTLGGESAQVVHRMLRSSDGSLLLAGAYQAELSVDDRTWTVNHSLHQTPFVASFDGTGELEWVQSEVIEHDHLRYLEERAENTHASMHTYVERPSLAERPSGGALAVVAHGEFLSRHGQDFEAPAVSTLTLVSMDGGGTVAKRGAVEEPRSLMQVAGAVSTGEALRLAGSFTGEFELDGRRFFAPDGRRLLFARISDEGTLSDARQHGMEGAGLTAHAACAQGGSVWVAARAVDLVTRDHDILVGRFEL